MTGEELQTEQAAPKLEEEHRSLLGALLTMEYGPCSVAAAELARAAATSMQSQVGEIFEEEKHIRLKIARAQQIVDSLEDRKKERAQADTGLNTTEHELTEHLRGDGLREWLVVSELSTPATQLCVRSRIGFETRKSNGYDKPVKQYLPFALVQNFEGKPVTVPAEVKKGRFKRREQQDVTSAERVPGDIWLADRIAGGRVLMPIATFRPQLDGACSYVQLGQEITDDSVFAVQSDEETKRLQLIDDLRKLVRTDNYRPEATDMVRAFVRGERERNAEHIVTGLGAWLAKTLPADIEKEGRAFRRTAMEPGADPVHEDIVTRFALARGEVDFGTYSVELEISQPVSEHGKNVPITLSAVTRAHVAFPIVEFFPETKTVRFTDGEAISHADRYKTLLAVLVLQGYDYAHDYDAPEAEFREAAGAEIKPADFIMQTHAIRQKIENRLSPECPKQEGLVRAIGAKALGRIYTGTVQGVAMTTTTGSIRGAVVVERINDAYQASISAVPDALEGMLMSELTSFVYDPTRQLGDRLPAGQDAAEFTALIEGFSFMEPASVITG